MKRNKVFFIGVLIAAVYLISIKTFELATSFTETQIVEVSDEYVNLFNNDSAFQIKHLVSYRKKGAYPVSHFKYRSSNLVVYSFSITNSKESIGNFIKFFDKVKGRTNSSPNLNVLESIVKYDCTLEDSILKVEALEVFMQEKNIRKITQDDSLLHICSELGSISIKQRQLDNVSIYIDKGLFTSGMLYNELLFQLKGGKIYVYYLFDKSEDNRECERLLSLLE
jgi:hypothetical protein